MRQIKFRAISKLKREPTFEFTLEELMRGQVSVGYPEHWHFCESTGLLDSNGKEIYEGDVVKIHNYKTNWKRGEPKIDWRIFQIVWNRYIWSLQNSVISKPLADYDTDDLMPYDIEVIGNIYENPSLLTHQ